MRFFKFSLWRAIITFLIGLLLIIWPEVAVRYLVMAVGGLFFIPGLISIFVYLHYRSKAQKAGLSGEETSDDDAPIQFPGFPLQALGSTLLGLWLMIMPSFFAGVLTFLMGCVLILLAFSQISSLVIARKLIPVRPISYLVPSLILLSGLFCLFDPVGVPHTVMIILGVTGIVYSINECFMWIRYNQLIKHVVPKESEVEEAVIVGEEIIDEDKK